MKEVQQYLQTKINVDQRLMKLLSRIEVSVTKRNSIMSDLALKLKFYGQY